MKRMILSLLSTTPFLAPAAVYELRSLSATGIIINKTPICFEYLPQPQPNILCHAAEPGINLTEDVEFAHYSDLSFITDADNGLAIPAQPLGHVEVGGWGRVYAHGSNTPFVEFPTSSGWTAINTPSSVSVRTPKVYLGPSVYPGRGYFGDGVFRVRLTPPKQITLPGPARNTVTLSYTVRGTGATYMIPVGRDYTYNPTTDLVYRVTYVLKSDPLYFNVSPSQIALGSVLPDAVSVRDITLTVRPSSGPDTQSRPVHITVSHTGDGTVNVYDGAKEIKNDTVQILNTKVLQFRVHPGSDIGQKNHNVRLTMTVP